MTIPTFEFSAQDVEEWRAMPKERRDHILGNILSTIIDEGDAFIKLVGPLSSETKDEIIHSYRTWFNRDPPLRNFRLTILFGVFVLIGSRFAGAGWVVSVAAALVCFLAVGIPLSRRDSAAAISKIAVRNPDFFELMWEKRLVELTVPALNMKFDARDGQTWQHAVEGIVGAPKLDDDSVVPAEQGY